MQDETAAVGFDSIAAARHSGAMKVTRRTEHRLIVEDRPILVTVLLGIVFVGTGIAAAGTLASGEILLGMVFILFTAGIAGAIYLFVRRVQIIFDRADDTLTIRSQTLRRYEQTVYPLHELSHAITEGQGTQRCVLVLDQGMSAGLHPVTAYLTSSPAPQRLTDAINSWLKQTAPVDSRAPWA